MTNLLVLGHGKNSKKKNISEALTDVIYHFFIVLQTDQNQTSNITSQRQTVLRSRRHLFSRHRAHPMTLAHRFSDRLIKKTTTFSVEHSRTSSLFRMQTKFRPKLPTLPTFIPSPSQTMKSICMLFQRESLRLLQLSRTAMSMRKSINSTTKCLSLRHQRCHHSTKIQLLVH